MKQGNAKHAKPTGEPSCPLISTPGPRSGGGVTDEYGYDAVENKVHVHDWHATILHLLGLDHEKLAYRYAGRDMRLTDVKGNVVKDIVA